MKRGNHTKVEVAERVGRVRKMLAAQVPHAEIVRNCSDHYSVTVQAVYVWIKRAYSEMEKDGEAAKPMRRWQLRASFEKVFQSAMTNKQYSAAIGALDRIARMDGLLDGPTTEINVSNTTNVLTMIAKKAADMSDEDLDKEIQSLKRLVDRSEPTGDTTTH